MFHIGFRPEKREATEEEYETAKQQVANLCDKWGWLPHQINAQSLTWPEIFELVAANI